MKNTIAFLAAFALAGSLMSYPAVGDEMTGEPVNHAAGARLIRASSEYSDEYKATFAADGIVRRQEMRLPNWMTNYEKEGTLTLTWETDQVLTRALFYDIGDMASRVDKVTMTFDDGTVLEMGALVNNGSPKGIDFTEPIRTKSVQIHVVGTAQTQAVGLSEVEFYDEAGNNVAPNAIAEADSEAYDGSPYWFIPVTYEGWYAAQNAVNGWADFNLPKKTVENEWASLAEATPSITFTWDEPVQIGTVVLTDRISSEDWILGGEITFDEGEPVLFGELDNYGEALTVDVPDVTTTTMTVHVTDSSGPNIGFAEIEIFTEHFDENGNVRAPEPEEPVEPDESAAEIPDESAENPASGTETPAVLPDVGAVSVAILVIFAAFLTAAVLSAIRSKEKKI